MIQIDESAPEMPAEAKEEGRAKLLAKAALLPSDKDERALSLLQSSILLAFTLACIALGLSLGTESFFNPEYFWQNRVAEPSRVRLLVGFMLATLGGALLVPLMSLVFRQRLSFSREAEFWVRKVLPLGPLAVAPLLFDWRLWQGHDQVFLACVLVNALAMGAAVGAFLSTPPLKEISPRLDAVLKRLVRNDRVLGVICSTQGNRRIWFGLIILAAICYMAWFGYHTTVWHLSAWSSYDLAIEDNILYNLLHGGPFFKAAPTLGPTGSHFGRHSTLISYALLPFYALHQSAETILVLQSVLMGVAAIPLFLFARRRVGSFVGFVIAITYLMHPAVQQSNLFEAHYVKFGYPFFWALLWLIDSGRNRWALLFAALTLFVREDVAAWVIMLGLWSALTGRSFRVGIGLTSVALVYVVTVKLVIMPWLSGGHSLMFMYEGLLPEGKTSFAWVLATATSNPSFLMNSLIEEPKITYLLLLIVPLGLLPLRNKLGWFALIPGGIFCLLATKYPPLTSIHFQYSPHFLAFLLPTLVLALEKPENSVVPQHLLNADQGKKVAILLMALLPTSYQFGAVLQGNTSKGGPIPYYFGWHKMGEERRVAVKALLKHLPPDAKVAASAFLSTQVSARPNAYSLWLGVYDADWMITPLHPHEFVPSELKRLREGLVSKEWGVVAIEEPFVITRKGHDTSLNGKVLRHIGRKRLPPGTRATGYFRRPPPEPTPRN